MRKIVDYITLTSQNASKLDVRVKEYLEYGYELYGFHSVCRDESYNSIIYSQVVVKYEEISNNVPSTTEIRE